MLDYKLKIMILANIHDSIWLKKSHGKNFNYISIHHVFHLCSKEKQQIYPKKIPL
jgi:hypothetical protein